jgi:hypothetical protein
MRATRGDAGRSYRAGLSAVRSPVRAHFAAHLRPTRPRRRGPRTPGHNTNE